MELTVILCCVGVIAGLVGLWWSSDKTIEYSLQLSQIFGITTFFIGFVLIAIATGLPELAISIAALWDNVTSVAAGSIIGSNLFDVSLVLGLPAVFFGTLNVKKEEKLNLMLMLVVTALVMAFIFVMGVLTPIIGVILLLLYVVSIWWLWKTRATQVTPREDVVEELRGDEKIKKRPMLRTKLRVFGKLSVSLFLVMASSKLSVDCAIVVARSLPLNLAALGATIFAIGTSLPELALSISAVRKKEYALAFGNSFGSILEQATLILGILVIGAPKPLDITTFRPVAPLMFLAYAIVAHAIMKKTGVGRQAGLGRKEGIALLLLGAAHLVYYVFWR